MKKVITVIIMAVIMLATATAYGLTTEEYIDGIYYLHNAEREWALNSEFHAWAEDDITEDGILRGLGMVTKDDMVFYDATPDTVSENVYCERLETALGVNNVVIENEVVGFAGGYGIYHFTVKWDGEINYLGAYPGAKGMDMLLVFYN